MTPTPDLRPRTVGEILDASFQLYRKRFGPLLLASTVLSLPALALAILLSEPASTALGEYIHSVMRYTEAAKDSAGAATPAMRKALDEMTSQAVEMQVLGLASNAMQALSRGAACLSGAFVAFAAVRREPTPSGWALVRMSLPRLLPATAVHFVVALVLMTCAICLPVPILLGAILAPACAAMVGERGSLETSVRGWSFAPARVLLAPVAALLDAVGRCFTLSMHPMSLARGTTVVSMMLLFLAAVTGVIAVAGGLAAWSIGVGFVLNHYAEVFFLPVVGIAFALWYLDLRVRREGLDLATEP